MFAGCIHVALQSATRRPVVFAEREGVNTADRKVGEKAKIHVGAQNWLWEDRRQKLDHYLTFLNRELRTEYVNAAQNYLSKPPELFDQILEIVTPAVERQETKPSPRLQLSMTLFFFFFFFFL